MNEKIKSLSPVISQMSLRKLGLYCSERLSIDQYYLMEAINLLISDVGEDYIEERYNKQGKNWKEIKEKLATLNKLLSKSKTFYDAIKDKKFGKKTSDADETQLMFERYFKKTASKISLMQRDLYDLFVFLVKETTLQRQQIPSEAFRILEHLNYRTIGKPHPTPPSTTTPTPGGSS